MDENKYYPGDPFFCVHCKNCGRKWWSTRRVNKSCKKCGSTDVVTTVPKHSKDDK